MAVPGLLPALVLVFVTRLVGVVAPLAFSSLSWREIAIVTECSPVGRPPQVVAGRLGCLLAARRAA